MTTQPTNSIDSELDTIIGLLAWEAWKCGTENRPFDQVWFKALESKQAIKFLYISRKEIEEG